MKTNPKIFNHSLIALLFLVVFVVNLALGSVPIPFTEILKGLTGQKMTVETWHIILFEYRLPKAITAILCGMGVAISGLLMKTLFRNPLAGPYVLGLSSGASLGVGILILGASILPFTISQWFLSSSGIALASCIGSSLVLLLVLLVSKKLKDTLSILLVGIMFGSFTSALLSVLSYFTSANQLQRFTFWSLGSLSNLTTHDLLILFVFIFIGLVLSFLVLKPLDTLLLGERYAKSLGVNFKQTKWITIIATSCMAGSITAFVGPIAFIGLAVPHLAKILFKTSNHKTLFWSTLLLGASLLLVCDTIAQLPGSEHTLPINAITSIFGAPVVIFLLMRRKNIA